MDKLAKVAATCSNKKFKAQGMRDDMTLYQANAGADTDVVKVVISQGWISQYVLIMYSITVSHFHYFNFIYFPVLFIYLCAHSLINHLQNTNYNVELYIMR